MCSCMCSPWAFCLSRRRLVNFFFSPLRFECGIGVRSSADTVFYCLTPALCTAVTSTSASPRAQTNVAFIFPPRSHPLSLNQRFVSCHLYHKVSTCTISASLLVFYGAGLVSEDVVIAVNVFAGSDAALHECG